MGFDDVSGTALSAASAVHPAACGAMTGQLCEWMFYLVFLLLL
jgi:hypothetical protein